MNLEELIQNNYLVKLSEGFETDFENNNDLLKSNINESRALVIGGAGTIGSNYIKELLKYKPRKLVVVDINENSLTELTRDLRSSSLLDYPIDYVTYPINLNSEIFNKIFWSDHFDLVANFSAHKHVRSEKDVISVEGMIRNNVFGAIKLLNLCSERPPNHFFSVSTDKATNPVNIMGASKSLMERLILSKKDQFKVSTARFANVAFSNGSLLDGFIHRINKFQPLSCPSDIKRFFVTPKQSGQICLLATFLGNSGNIFFPKLDFKKDQIFFKDIALSFLVKKGYVPIIMTSEEEAKQFKIKDNHGKYPIYLFKSDTSGEKPYEEFFTENETVNITKYVSLGYIKSMKDNIEFDDVITSFEEIFERPNSTKLDIISTIQKYISDFSHIETGKNLDQKM